MESVELRKQLDDVAERAEQLVARLAVDPDSFEEIEIQTEVLELEILEYLRQLIPPQE